MARARSPIPEGYHAVTPQLTLDNASEAIDWYKKALGAEEIGRTKDDEGRVLHAELRIGDSRIMLNDVMMGKGPRAFGGSPASLYLYVENSDSLFNRAIAAGGRVHGSMGALADQFWGDRSGTLIDPFGYQWTIATRKEELTRCH
jgi:PhnB protein